MCWPVEFLPGMPCLLASDTPPVILVATNRELSQLLNTLASLSGW